MLSYQNIRLSQNRLEVNVPAVSASVTDRTKLRYYLDICVPKSYRAAYRQSTEFEALIRLEASEVPPYEKLGVTIYEGAYFPIENYLDSLLFRKVPLFEQTGFMLCEELISPFYVVYTRMNDDELIDSVTLDTEYILKAGIAENDFPTWKEAIFKESSGLAGKFLTWSINDKLIDESQPEFLYFLTNFNPAPSSLNLVVRKYYSDNSGTTVTVYSLSGILPFSVYCFPVSIKALQLDTDPKEVIKYEIHLENEQNSIVSEKRTYQLDNQYHRHNRYILFSNSLGGFDTLRALGQSSETLSVSRQIAERYYPFGSTATYSERIINQVTGERELLIRTGFITKAELEYLQEIILAKEFYLVTDREFIPLTLTSEAYIHQEDDINIRGREFIFRYTNRVYNYSRLPIPPVVIARKKAWRIFGTPTCLLNKNGVRTGLGQFPQLEQYYTDDNSTVIPQTIKANTPGTEGYIGAVLTGLCEVTPYLNIRIKRPTDFRKTGCQNPYIGNYPDIVIEANTWGSEISQADADAKAEAYWQLFNNQEYADANGSCVLMKYLNIEIRRQGTFLKNNCVGVGYKGTTAEIVVPAGIFGSEESQEAANALAEASFIAIDTQTYANENGKCELDYQTGIYTTYWNYVFNDTEPQAGNFQTQKYQEVLPNPSFANLLATDTFADAKQNGFNTARSCIRFEGFIDISQAGNIDFIANVDDGMRLFIDNVAVIDHWYYEGGMSKQLLGTATNVPSGKVPFKAEFYNLDGFGAMLLKYKTATMSSFEVIPDNLFSYLP